MALKEQKNLTKVSLLCALKSILNVRNKNSRMFQLFSILKNTVCKENVIKQFKIGSGMLPPQANVVGECSMGQRIRCLLSTPTSSRVQCHSAFVVALRHQLPLLILTLPCSPPHVQQGWFVERALTHLKPTFAFIYLPMRLL